MRGLYGKRPFFDITPTYSKYEQSGMEALGTFHHFGALWAACAAQQGTSSGWILPGGLLGRAGLPADSFEEPVVIHPVFLRLVAEDGNPSGTHKGQLQNLPLLVRNIPLLGTDTTFLPQNRHRATGSNLDGAQTRDAPKMPVKIGSRLFSATGSQLVCASPGHPTRRFF